MEAHSQALVPGTQEPGNEARPNGGPHKKLFPAGGEMYHNNIH